MANPLEVLEERKKERERVYSVMTSLISEYLQMKLPLTGREIEDAHKKYLISLHCELYGLDCTDLSTIEREEEEEA